MVPRGTASVAPRRAWVRCRRRQPPRKVFVRSRASTASIPD